MNARGRLVVAGVAGLAAAFLALFVLQARGDDGPDRTAGTGTAATTATTAAPAPTTIGPGTTTPGSAPTTTTPPGAAATTAPTTSAPAPTTAAPGEPGPGPAGGAAGAAYPVPAVPSGGCRRATGGTVRVAYRAEAPEPVCLSVGPDQYLEVANALGTEIVVTAGAAVENIPPGEALVVGRVGDLFPDGGEAYFWTSVGRGSVGILRIG